MSAGSASSLQGPGGTALSRGCRPAAGPGPRMDPFPPGRPLPPGAAGTERDPARRLPGQSRAQPSSCRCPSVPRPPPPGARGGAGGGAEAQGGPGRAEPGLPAPLGQHLRRGPGAAEPGSAVRGGRPGGTMPVMKGLLAPQNTFLDTIATRFDGTRRAAPRDRGGGRAEGGGAPRDGIAAPGAGRFARTPKLSVPRPGSISPATRSPRAGRQCPVVPLSRSPLSVRREDPGPAQHQGQNPAGADGVLCAPSALIAVPGKGAGEAAPVQGSPCGGQRPALPQPQIPGVTAAARSGAPQRWMGAGSWVLPWEHPALRDAVGWPRTTAPACCTRGTEHTGHQCGLELQSPVVAVLAVSPHPLEVLGWPLPAVRASRLLAASTE